MKSSQKPQVDAFMEDYALHDFGVIIASIHAAGETQPGVQPNFSRRILPPPLFLDGIGVRLERNCPPPCQPRCTMIRSVLPTCERERRSVTPMQIRNITWECPKCHSRLRPNEFRVEWGSGGKRKCPSCHVELDLSPAYPKWALVALFPFLCFLIYEEGASVIFF